MAMRNFWAEARVAGRATDPTFGPRRADGGMSIYLRQRYDGVSVPACTIECNAYGNTLVTTVYDNEGNQVFEYRSKR